MRRRWQFHPALVQPLILVLLIACSHGEPFAPPDNSTSEPFAASAPLRLTYGGGTSPAWLGDDRIIYSFTSRERSNHRSGTPDECLGILPATGGRRIRTICNTSVFEADTLDVHLQPAPEPGTDRLAFLRARLSVGTASGLTNIVVGPIGAAPEATVLQSAIFNSSDGFMREAGLLRWLAPDTLVFLGADDGISSPCSTCDPIVIRRWKDAFRLPASGGATAEIIPGTRFATSLTAGPQPGQAYVTFAMDTTLIRLDLASGMQTVLAGFTPPRIPRDADYAGGRIAVIVGGKLTAGVDDGGDPLQGHDEGGELQIVNATTGEVTPMPNSSFFFRRPRFRPDGRALVVEGYRYTIISTPERTDTIVSPVADVYRIDLP